MKSDIFISVVTPTYELAGYLEAFHSRMTSALRQITSSYEIIVVNDGSTDESAEILSALAQKDDKVVFVDLSRNFGHHHAVMAGLDQARGERVFLIDVDLEEDPAWILIFNEKMNREDWDVVFGMQRSRKGFLFERISGSFFYQIFNLLSDTKIPPNACNVRLMKRSYVDAVLRMKDKNLYFHGTFAWIGFRQHAVIVDKKLRDTASTYTFVRKIRLTGNALASFTSKPLAIIFFIGIAISALSAVYGLAIIYRQLCGTISKSAMGWSSLIVSVWFIGGISIMFIGTVGLYLSKIFNEVKNRPNYVIRKIIRLTKEETV